MSPSQPPRPAQRPWHNSSRDRPERPLDAAADDWIRCTQQCCIHETAVVSLGAYAGSVSSASDRRATRAAAEPSEPVADGGPAGSSGRRPATVAAVTKLAKVIVYVDLESEAAKRAKAQRFRDSDSWADRPERLAEIVASILDPATYQMNVALAAQLDDGREITGGGFGFGGPRDGVAAIWHRYRGPQLHDDPCENERLLHETYHVGLSDVEDAVNQMLGRDPEQHRPPRLSWDGLQRALADEGITVTEQQLIDTPLELVLSESAGAELGADAPPT